MMQATDIDSDGIAVHQLDNERRVDVTLARDDPDRNQLTATRGWAKQATGDRRRQPERTRPRHRRARRTFAYALRNLFE
jgi:hypothetical protein